MARMLVLAVLGVLIAPRAEAAPITVSAGDFVVFNFDLTGETPPPPYERVGLNLQLGGLDFEAPPCSLPGDECAPLDKGEWNFWTELNGTGDVFLTFPAVNLDAIWNFLAMNDGVFSATLLVTDGSITVDPVVCGIASDGTRTPECPLVPPPPVPEPATVSLLALGVAILVRQRRTPRTS